jgi:hypothetical protein
MNGDPFATKAIIDRAKEVWNGVALYWQGIVEEEKRQYDAAHVVREPALVLHANDDCPECKEAGAMRDISADVVRCFACGHQNEIRNPPGSPNRTQLESWQGFGRK